MCCGAGFSPKQKRPPPADRLPRAILYDRGTTLLRQSFARLPSLPGRHRACAVTGAPAARLCTRAPRRCGALFLKKRRFGNTKSGGTASPAKLRDHVPPCGRRLLSAGGKLSVSRSRRGTLPITVVGYIDLFYIISVLHPNCQEKSCAKGGCGVLRHERRRFFLPPSKFLRGICATFRYVLLHFPVL